MPFRLITRREIQSPAPGRQNCNFEFQKAPAILALSLEPALRLWQAPTAVAIDCILLQSTICFPEASRSFWNIRKFLQAFHRLRNLCFRNIFENLFFHGKGIKGAFSISQKTP